MSTRPDSCSAASQQAIGGLVVGISIRAPFVFYAVTLTAATVVCLVMLRNPSAALQAGEAGNAPPSLDDPAEDSAYRDHPSATTGDEAAEGGRAPATDQGDSEIAVPLPLRVALRDRAYWAALAINMGNGFSIFGLRSALVPLFRGRGVAAGRGRGRGRIRDRRRRAGSAATARWSTCGSARPKAAMIISSVFSVAGMVLLALGSQVWLFYFAMAVFGVSGAFLGPAPSAVVGDVTRGRPGGTVVAVFQMVSDFGAIIGPLAAGAVLDSAGFGAAFGIGAVIMGIGLVAALMMPETLGRRTGARLPAT